MSGETLGGNLSSVLKPELDARLFDVVSSVANACGEISAVLRGGSDSGGGTCAVGSTNAFGDAQLEVDIHTNDVLMQHLEECGAVATASSEECPVETPVTHNDDGEVYSVAFDPLDGSSIVDCNWSVGTIFGIWKGRKLVGVRGRDLVCSGCAVYGPRTTLYITVPTLKEVIEFTLRGAEPSAWNVSRRTSRIGPGKLFAPANLRASQDNAGYKELMEFYMRSKYQLRYTGGMVPDVCQLFVKGKGVFTSPVSESCPAKLRLLYEALPMAFLVETGGGASSDGVSSLLDRVVSACEERTPVCLGSAEEVDRFNKFCGASEQRDGLTS